MNVSDRANGDRESLHLRGSCVRFAVEKTEVCGWAADGVSEKGPCGAIRRNKVRVRVFWEVEKHVKRYVRTVFFRVMVFSCNLKALI